MWSLISDQTSTVIQRVPLTPTRIQVLWCYIIYVNNSILRSWFGCLLLMEKVFLNKNKTTIYAYFLKVYKYKLLKVTDQYNVFFFRRVYKINIKGYVGVVRRPLESWWRQPTFRRAYADHLSLRLRARRVLVWVTVSQPPAVIMYENLRLTNFINSKQKIKVIHGINTKHKWNFAKTIYRLICKHNIYFSQMKHENRIFRWYLTSLFVAI